MIERRTFLAALVGGLAVSATGGAATAAPARSTATAAVPLAADAAGGEGPRDMQYYVYRRRYFVRRRRFVRRRYVVRRRYWRRRYYW
jgi:hypothetical protein